MNDVWKPLSGSGVQNLLPPQLDQRHAWLASGIQRKEVKAPVLDYKATTVTNEEQSRNFYPCRQPFWARRNAASDTNRGASEQLKAGGD
jgi:hypothetical protein